MNNFVSGLILLFERPLHVGDKITVGDTSGEVKDIGIRASRIHTWEGADVIIPNGNLISGSFTNWTLSDDRRRGELKVGVAYGMHPGRVLRILREVASAQPLIVKEPAPIALFTGFGESSLDFCVRYWTHLENYVDANSHLHEAVCERLANEGIEIPFPQRDLNVRERRARGGCRQDTRLVNHFLQTRFCRASRLGRRERSRLGRATNPWRPVECRKGFRRTAARSRQRTVRGD